MCGQPNSQAQRKKYPGHRACFNHEILTEGMKLDIPETCPNCFARISKHQINLIGLLYTRSFIQGNRIDQLELDLAELRAETTVRIEDLALKVDLLTDKELVQLKEEIQEIKWRMNNGKE